jgi:hypothetical protein
MRRPLSLRTVRRLINFWPPFFFTGIRLIGMSDDGRGAEAELRLRWWNRNAVGTMFGGSLFAMTDPFYPLMLQYNLGPGYIVWTKSASMEFVSPGRTIARAGFLLSPENLDEIRRETASGKKFEPVFYVDICDPAAGLIAKVSLTLYVRKSRQIRNQSAEHTTGIEEAVSAL